MVRPWPHLQGQLVRREHDMASAISPGLLEAQGETAVGQFVQPVVGNRRPGKVTTEMFEAIAIIGSHADIRVHIESGGAS